MQASKAKRREEGTSRYLRAAFEMPTLRKVNVRLQSQMLTSLVDILSGHPVRAMEAAKRLVGMPSVPFLVDSLSLIAARAEYKTWSRIAAVYALGFFTPSSSSRHQFIVREIAQDRSNNTQVRSHACEALGNLADKDAVKALREILVDTQEPTSIRKWCIYALSQIDSLHARQAIDSFARTNPRGVLGAEIFAAGENCLQEVV